MRLTRASIAATMPDPVGAIVAFDATKRMFTVIADKKLLDGVEKGGSLDYEGKQLTVLELCKTVNDARVMCDEKKAALNEAMVTDEIGIAKIVFDENGDTISEEAYTGESTPTINDVESMDGITVEDGESADAPYGTAAMESVDTIKDVLQNLMDDFADDVIRINRRYQEIREVLVKFYGTAPDGSIVNSFEREHPQHLKLGSKAVVNRSIMDRRYLEQPMELSYFDKLADMEKKRTTSKRRFESDDDESEYSAKPAPKRAAPAVPGQVGRAPAQMSYPFITREVETQIFKGAGGSASNYAQKICKLLFANSLQEYFKDQDPRKRDWIHEAVDYRFPSEDKCAQILKWKNCSNSINKNMKEAEKIESNKKTKDRNINFRYLNKEYEESCYAKANGDSGKYAELLSFKLFAKTIDKFFKEQDQTKKDWIRECVDIRYPIADAEKRTSRWKVCAAACNKNRTKVIGADGEENPYPFFPKEVEEDCFKKSQGVPYVYAELMARLLFPDTQNYYFKEQDLGRRNWLHMTLDKRFPTPDKVAQIAKWKSCTSAINKNKDAPADTSVNFDVLENNENDNDSEEDEEEVEEPAPVKPASAASSRSRTTLKDENKVEEDDVSVQSVSSLKRSRRSQAVDSAEPSVSSPPTISPTTSNTVTRSKTRTPKKGAPSFDSYTSYPFLSEEDEIECLEAAKGNPQIYARSVGKILFRDSIKLYYKDQEPGRRTWMKDIVDFRFPTPDAAEQKQKWKNVTAAINKNMTLR